MRHHWSSLPFTRSFFTMHADIGEIRIYIIKISPNYFLRYIFIYQFRNPNNNLQYILPNLLFCNQLYQCDVKVVT